MSYTRSLMSSSAVLLGLLGLTATFLPGEILAWIGTAPSAPLVLLVQVLGALYLGFAMLNWMTRENLIGAIYSRPVLVGNLLHFMVVAIALTKALVSAAEARLLWPLALVYVGFALGFALLLFRHPVRSPARVATPVRDV